jgi:hypothetical protein
MKQLFMMLTAALFITSGCRKIEVDGTVSNPTPTQPQGTENTILKGTIKVNTTLKANYTYKLRGLVYVT